MVKIKTADIGALVAYERMVGASYTDVTEPRHLHTGDAYEFITCIAISKASLQQLSLPGHLGEALIYQAPVDGRVTEAESLVMNIAALLDVPNDKAAILTRIDQLIAFPPKVVSPPAGEEPVRVLRVIEYTGPRRLVERQVQMSLHGTRGGLMRLPGEDMPQASENDYGPSHTSPVQITAVTLGEYPEVLEAAKATVLAPTPIPYPAGTRGAALQAHAKTALANLRGAVGDNLPEMDAAIDAVCQVLSINPDDVYRSRPGTPLDTPPSPVVESAPQPTPASDPESAAAVRSDGPDPEIPF